MNTIQVIGNSKRQVTADFRSRRKLPNSQVLRIRSTHVFFLLSDERNSFIDESLCCFFFLNDFVNF